MAQRAYTIPQGYNAAIDAAAQRNGLDANTLRGVIAQESAFRPGAVSPTGAVGLGQVLPSTARDPGYGIRGIDPATLRDPYANIDFAAQYVAARGTPAAYSGQSYQTVQPIGPDGLPSGPRVSTFRADPNNPYRNAGATDAGTPMRTAAGTDPQGNPLGTQYDAGGSPLFPPGAGTDPMGNQTGVPGYQSGGTTAPGPPGQNGGLQQSDQRNILPVLGLHDWFRRFAIAILALVMLAVALIAITREGAVAHVRKATGL